MRPNERRNRELMGDTSSRALSWTHAAAAATNKPALGATMLVVLTAVIFIAGVWQVPAALLLVPALLAIVIPQLSSPGFWKRLRANRTDTAPTLPDPLEFRDPMVGALVQRVGRAREVRARVTARSPYGPHHGLAGSQNAVAEIERRAIVVAARAEHVSVFLSELSEASISADSDVIRMRSAEQAAGSDEASTAYRRAAAWSLDRRETVRRLEVRRAELIGSLEHLAALLETLPAKVTDLELRRIDEGDRLIGADISDAETALAELDAPFSGSLPTVPADPGA